MPLDDQVASASTSALDVTSRWWAWRDAALVRDPGHGLGAAGIIHIGNDDRHPAWAKPDGDGLAQAAAATRDDRDPAREVEQVARRSPAGRAAPRRRAPAARSSVRVLVGFTAQLGGSLG